MRRIGSTPAQRGCGANNSCPDVIDLDDGSYFVIGKGPLADGSSEA
ncbi:hypothetical protein ACFYZJ_08450 [Streptomyces sp. NPDC001848]